MKYLWSLEFDGITVAETCRIFQETLLISEDYTLPAGIAFDRK